MPDERAVRGTVYLTWLMQPRSPIVSTVAIPVTDQDRTKALFEGLGFETRFDADLGGGFRWIELVPPGADTSIAVVATGDELPTGIDTGIRLVTPDARRRPRAARWARARRRRAPRLGHRPADVQLHRLRRQPPVRVRGRVTLAHVAWAGWGDARGGVRNVASVPGAPMLGVLLVVAGCADSSDAGSSSTTTAPPPETTAPAPEPVGGLVAEIGINRLYAVDRAFGLVLRNVTDAPIVVQEMQLDSDQFETMPATERTVTLPAGGRRLVLALPYGEARCDDEAGETFPVVVVLDDGEELRLDAPEEYEGAVARLHARECATADVLERVDITFGDDLGPGRHRRRSASSTSSNATRASPWPSTTRWGT